MGNIRHLWKLRRLGRVPNWAGSAATGRLLHQQLRAALDRRARDYGAAARDALARGRWRALLHPVHQQVEGAVRVRLDELELDEVAARLPVLLDVVAVLHL